MEKWERVNGAFTLVLFSFYWNRPLSCFRTCRDRALLCGVKSDQSYPSEFISPCEISQRYHQPENLEFLGKNDGEGEVAVQDFFDNDCDQDNITKEEDGESAMLMP
jgi:hypothetical protein